MMVVIFITLLLSTLLVVHVSVLCHAIVNVT